jgi:hypothetical protein
MPVAGSLLNQDPLSQGVIAQGDHGVGPSLLDYIFDVDAALERRHNGSKPAGHNKQQQRVVPRLHQRQEWLRSQGRPSSSAACFLGPSESGARGGDGRMRRQVQGRADELN